MNLASWIILLIVVGIVVLALRATLGKGKGKGGCCDCGDAPHSVVGSCGCSCSGCHGCDVKLHE